MYTISEMLISELSEENVYATDMTLTLGLDKKVYNILLKLCFIQILIYWYIILKMLFVSSHKRYQNKCHFFWERTTVFLPYLFNAILLSHISELLLP